MIYLSANSCLKLDGVIKTFEVAYRSFITEAIALKFPSETEFKIAVDKLKGSYNPNSVMFTNRYYEKIKKIEKELAT